MQAIKENFPDWGAAGGHNAEPDAYEDMRWRLIRLEPQGSAWDARVAEIAAAVAAGRAGRELVSLSGSKAEALLQGASLEGRRHAAGA